MMLIDGVVAVEQAGGGDEPDRVDGDVERRGHAPGHSTSIVEASYYLST